MGKPRDMSGYRVQKTDDEWRTQLTPEQYHVAREAGTERAFSDPDYADKSAGIYHCVCCNTPLFEAEAKFDSGTGWPSFWQPLDGAVGEISDNSFFMRRTEIVCNECGAHLGHVFNDGPEPTGLRYCMNGVALRLAKK